MSGKGLLSLLLIACVLAGGVQCTSLGDGFWRTLTDALLGHATALPLTIADAESQGWYAMNEGVCDTSRGIRYAQDSNQVTEDAPVTLYFTASGLIAGSAMDVFGEGAAPQKLVDAGFWTPVKNSTQQWSISVSFRNSTGLCSSSYTSDEVLGDQLVINQGTPAAWSVPLTAQEALCQNWFPGSCMVTMGQHWFYDIESSPTPSWESQNLLPIVAMYYPPDETGTLSTFFFTTPTVQPGSALTSKPGDWEPAITADDMCFNFCDDSCHWDVPMWNTLHMYVNSQWSYISCPNGGFPLDRYCPTPFTENC